MAYTVPTMKSIAQNFFKYGMGQTPTNEFYNTGTGQTDTGYLIGGNLYTDPLGAQAAPSGSQYATPYGQQYVGPGGTPINGGLVDKNKSLGSSNSNGTGGSSNISNQINAMYAAQRQANEARINSAYESGLATLAKNLSSAMANLDTAQSGIKDTYYGKRNQAASQSDIGAMNWAQNAAALGIKGNAAMQPEIYRTVALQNALTNLNKSEAQQNSAIDTQRSLAQNNYATDLGAMTTQRDLDLAAAGSTTDAQALQAAINELLRQSELQANQTAETKDAWLGTIGRFANDYQAEINRVQNDGDPSNDWQLQYLQAARQDKINAQNQNNQQVFMDTIGQYAGRYGQQADLIQNDGDPSNDWQIPYLRTAAAEEAAALAAQQSGGSGGGSGGSSGGSSNNLTFPQLYNTTEDIYSTYGGQYGQLSEEGKQALYQYITTYGGEYADQLLARYGLTSAQPSGTSGGTSYDNALNRVQTMMNSVGTGASITDVQNSVADYLYELIQQGFPRDQAVQIAQMAGITFN